jgi:hypothetical protein
LSQQGGFSRSGQDAEAILKIKSRASKHHNSKANYLTIALPMLFAKQNDSQIGFKNQNHQI